VLYHLSHISSPFCSGYFGDRSLFPQVGLVRDFPIYASCSSWYNRHELPRPTIGCDEISWTFGPRCPQTLILPISASWVTYRYKPMATGLTSFLVLPFQMAPVSLCLPNLLCKKTPVSILTCSDMDILRLHDGLPSKI
jgi:hypothetical protein